MRGNPALRFKATSQTPILSICLSKLLDPDGQNHLPLDLFLALLLSKLWHSTREGSARTRNPPLGFPRESLRGGGWWTFPARGDPICPHTPGTNIG